MEMKIKLMEVFCNMPTAFHLLLQYKSKCYETKKALHWETNYHVQEKISLVALKIVTLNTGKVWKLYILPEEKVEDIKDVFKRGLEGRSQAGW